MTDIIKGIFTQNPDDKELVNAFVNQWGAYKVRCTGADDSRVTLVIDELNMKFRASHGDITIPTTGKTVSEIKDRIDARSLYETGPQYTLQQVIDDLTRWKPTQDREPLSSEEIEQKAKELLPRINQFCHFTRDVIEPQERDYGEGYFEDRQIGLLYWFDGECCCSKDTVESWFRDTDSDNNEDDVYESVVLGLVVNVFEKAKEPRAHDK